MADFRNAAENIVSYDKYVKRKKKGEGGFAWFPMNWIHAGVLGVLSGNAVKVYVALASLDQSRQVRRRDTTIARKAGFPVRLRRGGKNKGRPEARLIYKLYRELEAYCLIRRVRTPEIDRYTGKPGRMFILRNDWGEAKRQLLANGLGEVDQEGRFRLIKKPRKARQAISVEASPTHPQKKGVSGSQEAEVVSPAPGVGAIS